MQPLHNQLHNSVYHQSMQPMHMQGVVAPSEPPVRAVAPPALPSSHRPMSAEEEIEVEAGQIQKYYGEKREALVSLLAGQLGVLKQQAQVILTLCGLVITVTGFSGGNVIKAGSTSSGFLVAGIVCILSSLPIAVATLGQIRWVTQDLEDDTTQFIKTVIRRRDVHRFRLMIAIALLVVGLACYMTAVSIAATVNGQVRETFTPPPAP